MQSAEKPRSARRAGFLLLFPLFAFLGCTRPSPIQPSREGPGPLPEGAFRVEWISATPVSGLAPGASATFAVSFRNRGSATWPDPVAARPTNPDGMFAVRLASRWRDARGHRVLVDFGVRSDLPWPVQPGEGAILPCNVQIPATAGNYELEFQLVQEGVAWFGSKGAERLILPVSVAAP